MSDSGLTSSSSTRSCQGVQFAHDPVISAETIGLQLAPLMRPMRADAGFQFDVDSDRVGIATETGEAVSEELILPMITDWLLPRVPGKIIITNLSSTRLVEDVAVAPWRACGSGSGRTAGSDRCVVRISERADRGGR